MTDAIKSVHRSLIDHTEGLQKAIVGSETAHLTLMVTALQSEEEVQKAEAAMGAFAAELANVSSWAAPLTLTLQGLSHFRHQVWRTSM